jgi:hypothetical protein
VDLRNSIVARPVAFNLKESFFVPLANIATIQESEDTDMGRANKTILDESRRNTIAALDNVLARSPYFVGQYSSAGLN